MQNRRAGGYCGFAVFVGLVLLVWTEASGQAIDTVLFLPDSFVGPRTPTVVCVHPGRGKAYIGGRDGTPAMVVLEGSIGQKTARVRLAEDAETLVLNPTSDLVYAVGRNQVVAVDAAADTVRSILAVEHGPGVAGWSSSNNGLYVAKGLYGSVLHIDGASHTPVDSISIPMTPVAITSCDRLHKLYVAGREDAVAVVAVDTDSVLRIVDVGDSPSALAVNEDSGVVYCANRLGGTVSVIDAAGDSLLTTVRVGAGPVALVHNPTTGRVYCACRSSGQLFVLDGGSHQPIGSLPMPSPQSLALSSEGDRLYVGSTGDLVTVVDCAIDTIIGRVPVGRDVRNIGFLPGQGLAVAVSADNGNAVLLSGDSLVGSVQVASSFPNDAVVAGDKLYVAQQRVDRVDVVSLVDHSILARVPVGSGPYSVCYSTTSDKVYCACRDGAKVAVIDAAADTLIKLLDVRNSPHDLAWDSAGNKVYCGNYGEPYLSVINCRTDSVIATIPVGRATRKVLYNPLSRRIYLACHDTNEFLVLDCAGDSVLARFTTGGNPWTIALDHADNYVFCNSSWGGPVVCGYGDTLVGEIGDVFYVKGACWNPVNNLAYAALNYSNQVLVIDGPSRTIVDRVTVDDYPAEMVSMPDNGRVYLVHWYSGRVLNQVSVIEDDSLLTSFSVRESPVVPVVDPERGRVYVLSGDASCATVIQDRPSATSERGASNQERELVAAPNPFSSSVMLHASRFGQNGARLFDCAGRPVRRLEPGAGNRILWDGRDEKGKEVGAGVYLAVSGRARVALVKAD